MPLSSTQIEAARQAFEKALRQSTASMDATNSVVFDKMNAAINNYTLSIHQLIYGLSEQIDDLKAEVKRLQTQAPAAPVLSRTLR